MNPDLHKKRIVLLGSTGSIGRSTLDVIRSHPHHFSIEALAARQDIDLLEKQIREFQPKVVAVENKQAADQLSLRMPHLKILKGRQAAEQLFSHVEADLCVSAMSGLAGLLPTLKAIETGLDIALANKEVLVGAGHFVMQAVKHYGVSLLPIDSEHSAIFQCLQGYRREDVDRLILTASGGPFFRKEGSLDQVTLEEALVHPTWKMGPKNTIDSSTLMNKGLEVIEAHWLFNIPLDKIEVVIHPQSLVHSFVEFIDGSLLAQLSENTMAVPIQWALSYPQKLPRMVKPFDFSTYARYEFYLPDKTRFPCLRLAYEALREGGTLPCFMNAANEVLVARFLSKDIRWSEIACKLETLMQKHETKREVDLSELLEVDRFAREKASIV